MMQIKFNFSNKFILSLRALRQFRQLRYVFHVPYDVRYLRCLRCVALDMNSALCASLKYYTTDK